MIIDKATGLPEVPKDHYWAVMESNSPVKGTLRVELRCVVRMKVSNIVDKPLPKKWYHIGYTPVTRLVVWETIEDYNVVYAESLIDTHIRHVKDGVDPEGAGWEQEDLYHTSYRNGTGRMVSLQTTVPTMYRFYRKHPDTPESVLAAATKIYERMEAAQEAEAARLRGAEDRAKLIGKYPPKTLKG